MAVRRHGDKWRADLRDEFANRERKNFDKKADADTYYAERKREILSAKLGGKLGDPELLFSAWAERYFKEKEARGIDKGTVVRERMDYKNHLAPAFGDLRIRELTRARAETFFLKRLGESAEVRKKNGKPYERRTVNLLFSTLSAMLSAALAAGVLREHPLRGLRAELNKGKHRAGKKKKKKVRALDTAQAALFVRGAQRYAPGYWPYFAMLMWAGLRPSEGIAVEQGNVDFTPTESAPASYLVEWQLHKHGGKKPPKSGLERTVDVSEDLKDVLRATIVARKAEWMAASAGERAQLGEWIFFPKLGKAPTELAIDSVYRRALTAMRRVLRKVGLPTYYSLHSLRHTYGVGLISRGNSPVYVQQQMGHARIDETVDTYGSWFPVRAKGAVDAFSRATLQAEAGAEGAGEAGASEGAVGGGGHDLDTSAAKVEAKAV